MIEQLEVQEAKDMPAEELAQRIRDFSAAAMATLNGRREAAFAAAFEPLETEKESLTQEHVAIEEARVNLERLLPARSRVAQAEADVLTLAGDAEGAEAKLQEAQEAANAPTAMTERQRAIHARIEAIEVEKRTALRRAGEDFLKASILLIRASETGLALCLDESRAKLNHLETLLGTTLYMPDNLTADARSRQWNTLNRLYGGRR